MVLFAGFHGALQYRLDYSDTSGLRFPLEDHPRAHCHKRNSLCQSVVCLKHKVPVKYKGPQSCSSCGYEINHLKIISSSNKWAQEDAGSWRNLGVSVSVCVSACLNIFTAWSPLFVQPGFIAVIFLVEATQLLNANLSYSACKKGLFQGHESKSVIVIIHLIY